MSSRRSIFQGKCATVQVDGALKPLGSLPLPRNGRVVADMDKFVSSELAGAIINESRGKRRAASDLGFLIDVIFATFREEAYANIRPEDLLCTPGSLKEHSTLLIQPTATTSDTEQVHLYDAQQKRWNWVFPSGNSSTKGKLSHEAQIALFLNTIASAVAASVQADDPTISPRKQRYWMADWSHQCLAGSTTGYSRKPDMILTSSATVNRDEITWLSAKVIGEYTREPYQPASRLGKTMDTKAYLVLLEQSWRRFVLGLSIANDELRLHLYDHSGGAVSPPFNIHTEPDTFLFILSAVVFGVRSCIGFDATIKVNPPPKYTRRQAAALLALALGESRETCTETDIYPPPSTPPLPPFETSHPPAPGAGTSAPLEQRAFATTLPPSTAPLEPRALAAEPSPSTSSLEPRTLTTDATPSSPPSGDAPQLPCPEAQTQSSAVLPSPPGVPHPSVDPTPSSPPSGDAPQLPCPEAQTQSSAVLPSPPGVPHPSVDPTPSSPPLGSGDHAPQLPDPEAQTQSSAIPHPSVYPTPSSPPLGSGDHATQLPGPEAPSPRKTTPSIGTIMVHDTLYEIIDILFSSAGFLGRGTICYLVLRNEEYYVIKDHWVQNDPRLQHQGPLNETNMMKLVQGIDGVPTLVDFWEVEVLPGIADTTQRYRQEIWHPHMKSKRTHVRLVMRPCARPLTMFKTKKELVSCIADILRIQQQAVEERGVLHRDCSINNAMIEDIKDGARGFLLDWEFAVRINKQNEYEIGGTGTVPYLSVNLLEQLAVYMNPTDSSSIRKSASLSHINIKTSVSIRHTYADDIESLFYVFIWILVLYDGPLGREREGVSHENTLLSFWSEEASNNLSIARFAKFTFLVCKRSGLESQVSPYFHDLVPLAESWRELLGKYVHVDKLVPYDEVIELLDAFLAKMPDEKPPEMTLTLHELAKQHRLLDTALPPRRPAKLNIAKIAHAAKGADDTGSPMPNLRDEVRSTGSKPYPAKRFKAM